MEGQAALTLALGPRDYPIDRIEVGKEYDVEFDQRGYVIGFFDVIDGLNEKIESLGR